MALRTMALPGRSGGTGRRAGLKIRFPKGSVGSIPTFGTSLAGRRRLPVGAPEHFVQAGGEHLELLADTVDAEVGALELDLGLLTDREQERQRSEESRLRDRTAPLSRAFGDATSYAATR